MNRVFLERLRLPDIGDALDLQSGDDIPSAILPWIKGAKEESSRLSRQVRTLREALEGMISMHDALAKRLNWGASALNAEAIRMMNEAPAAARAALDGTKEGGAS